MKRSTFLLWCVLGVVLGAVALPLGLLLLPAGAEASGGTPQSYVSKSGDTMNGRLTMNLPSSAQYVLNLNGIGKTFRKGICFSNPTSAGGCATGLEFNPATAYWQFIGGSFVTGPQHLEWGGPISSAAAAQPAIYTGSTGWFQSAGDTAANIATRVPSAGSGALIYDDTNTRWAAYVNGAWTYVQTGAPAVGSGTVVHANLIHGISTGAGATIEAAALEETNFLGPMSFSGTAIPNGSSVQIGTVACNWLVAGTGGAGTEVGVEVRNITDNTQVCLCALGACTTAALTPLSCQCSGTISVANSTDNFAIRITGDTDCTANPTAISCNVTGTYTFP